MADEDTTVEETEDTAPATEDPSHDDTPDKEAPKDKPSEPDWKAEARKHERRSKEASKKLKEYEERISAIDEANKTEQERLLDAARKEAADSARREVAGSFQQRILKAEIRARAAGKFQNPALAIKLVDLQDDDAFDEDGDINGDAIDTALAKVLEDEPYLRVGAAAEPEKKLAPASDAGKGKPAGGKTLEELTPDEHFKAINSNR